MKKSFADILAREKSERLRKLASKLPCWASVDGLTFPSSLNLEQASSQRTALYKAQLSSSFVGSDSGLLWDLTGGLGVDSWAFSQKFTKVIYNEHDPVLAAAVETNFSLLGVDNVEVVCSEAEDLKLPGVPDMIYLDPARRDDTGKKVFLVEDCRPDVLSMLPRLFELCPTVMVKLSPMADISMLAGRFEAHLKEMHIVGIGGECKELLCILVPCAGTDFRIVVSELEDDSLFSFNSSESAALRIADAQEGDWLWEPRAPLMKAGCFSLFADRFGIAALDASTHLFVSKCSSDNFLFKSFRIVEILEFGNVGFREAARKYPCAGVTARNVPIKSEELRKRLGCRPDSDCHIFACLTPSGRKLLVTKCLHHSER